VYVDWHRRIEGADRLFEGEEAVLYVMGDQIRETKRRTAPGGCSRLEPTPPPRPTVHPGSGHR